MKAIVGLGLLVVALSALVGNAFAHGAAPTSPKFDVTVRGTIMETVSYAKRQTSDGCEYLVDGGGSRATVFRSARSSRVVLREMRLGGEIRRISGTVTDSLGSANGRSESCSSSVHADCFRAIPIRFSGATARLTSTTRSFGLEGLRHHRLPREFQACGIERTIFPGMDIRPARASLREMLARAKLGSAVTVKASYERTLSLPQPEYVSGQLWGEVRWTMTFRRVR